MDKNTGGPGLRPGSTMLVLLITREDVITMHTASLLERLRALTDSVQRCREFVGSCEFAFGGFDDDPRELADIPECRNYLRAVHAQWKYWGHFLSPHADAFYRLIGLLCDTRHEGVHDGLVQRSFVSGEQLARRVNEMASAMFELHARMGLDEASSNALVQRMLAHYPEPGQVGK